MTPINTPRTNRPESRRLAAIGAAAGLMLFTGACSAGGSDQKAQAKSAVATTAAANSKSTSKSTTTTSGSKSNRSTTTTAPKAEDTEVIASSTGQLRADPLHDTPVPLRLDIHSVKRLSGDTVEVRFSITNTGDVATFKPYNELGDTSVNGGTSDVGGMALLDRPNDKKYLTLYDTKDVCLCTGDNNVAIGPGQALPAYADVTAPPASVSTVDLSMPGFAPIAGLKIR